MRDQLHRDGASDWRPSHLPPVTWAADQGRLPAAEEGGWEEMFQLQEC